MCNVAATLGYSKYCIGFGYFVYWRNFVFFSFSHCRLWCRNHFQPLKRLLELVPVLGSLLLHENRRNDVAEDLQSQSLLACHRILSMSDAENSRRQFCLWCKVCSRISLYVSFLTIRVSKNWPRPRELLALCQTWSSISSAHRNWRKRNISCEFLPGDSAGENRAEAILVSKYVFELFAPNLWLDIQPGAVSEAFDISQRQCHRIQTSDNGAAGINICYCPSHE